MRTQIFLASTLYGAATLAAAVDAGCFAPADRRLLLVSNNAATPETAPSVEGMAGFETLRRRFDDVVSWNEAIRPFHPSGWSPRPDDAPLWERHLRMLWGLGEPGRDGVELVLESLQVDPALAVAQVFPDAPIEVYADGLMSYGPTRNRLDPLVGSRVRRLLHPELVPGLRPLLLTEFGVASEVVPTAAFTSVMRELAGAVPDEVAQAEAEADADADGPALLLGQYLAALGILTDEEEELLHLRMLRGAAALGHRHVVFKPHPVAPPGHTRRLEMEAVELGLRLRVLRSPVLAEVLYERLRPALVAGCFSTALFTAAGLHGLPVARTGTALLLERLAPYQNSNRVPVTLADAVLPDLESPEAVREWRMPGAEEVSSGVARLVRAVGYCMQAQMHPKLREEAVRFLSTRLDEETWRYFKRRRLTSLGLPGGLPARLSFLPRNAAVRRVVRRARSVRRAVSR